MREILLLLGVVCVFAIGYFLIKGLDDSLEESREEYEKRSDKKEASCVMLDDDLSDEQLLEEIHRFRQKHTHTIIYLMEKTEDRMSG